MKKLAVHLHLYYLEQLDEILEKLCNLLEIDFDLFVTMSKVDEEVKRKILNKFSNAKVFVVANRGYDIGPFIWFLHQINLDDYEYVLKLHTKGKKSSNYTFIKNRRLDNALWGKIMWDSMLKSKERVRKNIQILDSNENIGMVGSTYCFSNEERHYLHLMNDINIAMEKMGFQKISGLSFIAGCMFMCRAKVLKPLLIYSLNDFDETNGKVKDETLAHVVERLFGAIVLALGYDIFQVKNREYFWDFFKIAFKRALIQKKVTKSGKTIVKVCKIPVYIKDMEV